MITRRALLLVFLIPISLLTLLGLLNIEEIHQVLLVSKFGYEYIFSVLFMLFSYILLYKGVKYFYRNDSFDIFRPSIVIGGVFVASEIGGSGSYVIAWLIWPHFVLDISNSIRVVGLSICLIGIAIAFTYLLIRPYIANNKKITTLTEINVIRLKKALIVTFLLGFVGSVLVYTKLGFIPILKNLTVAERANLGNMVGSGLPAKLFLILMITIILSLIYLMKVGYKNILGLTIFVLSSAFLFGYGARFFFVMPVLVAVFCFNRYKMRIKLKQLLLGFVFVFPLLISYVTLREDNSTASAVGVYGFAFFLFGEFRDFTYMLDKLGHFNQYLGGSTLINVVYTALPQQVWEVFGINKMGEMYSSATFSANFLYKADSGIRIGMLGEFFINFGYSGVFIGAFIFGLFIGILDIFYESIPAKSAGQILIAFLTVNFVFSVIGQIDGVFSTIYYYGYVLIAALLYVRERRENIVA